MQRIPSASFARTSSIPMPTKLSVMAGATGKDVAPKLPAAKSNKTENKNLHVIFYPPSSLLTEIHT